METSPWPGDPAKRPLVYIVGRDAQQLILEFHDTLYNAKIADSIGMPPITFSTDVVVGNRSARRLTIAQEAVLRFYDLGRRREQPIGQTVPDEGQSGPLLFEVRIGLDDPTRASTVLTMLQEKNREAFSGITE